MLGFETRELNVEVAVQSFVICREQFDTKRWLGSKLQTLYRKSDALNLSKLSWWSTRKYWSNLWRRALECEKGLIKYLSSSRCFSREEAILSCSPILWMLWLIKVVHLLKWEKWIEIVKKVNLSRCSNSRLGPRIFSLYHGSTFWNQGTVSFT